jgi:hypothetical protein
LALSSIIVISGYLLNLGSLAWYFTWIYFCLPYLKLNKAQIFSILFLQLSLTLTYAGFLQYGLWGTYPGNQAMVAIIRSTKLFFPLFLLATVYPYFLEKIKTRRFC